MGKSARATARLRRLFSSSRSFSRFIASAYRLIICRKTIDVEIAESKDAHDAGRRSPPRRGPAPTGRRRRVGDTLV
jgi:hypothetical protein